MKIIKAHLLGATIVAAGFPVAAQAQFAYPAAEVRGVGASSIQNVLVQTLNCNGNPGDHSAGNSDNLNRLGTNTGALNPVAEGSFVQTNPTNASPDFDCNRQEIQPNVEGKYVATGSGTGRAYWRTFTNQLPGTTASNINPFGSWPNVQFAFSDAPVSASDLSAYDANANNTTNQAGAPIQIPLYVLPVALAYNPVYGRVRTANGTRDLKFNVNPKYVTTDSAGNPTGGIRMSRNVYCRIFNGYLTNWNDKVLSTSGVAKSLADTQDSATRWKNEGAPIRLVGRLDNSGTTDIFTRHLAQVCTGQAGVAVNKFAVNAEALPFDKNSSIDLRGFRGDTRYYPNTTGALAGTVQSLSGAVFVRQSGSTPASIETAQGSEAAGLFLVADGSSGVRDAINYQEDPSATVGAVALNGKLGYIGADFVKPSPSATLFSASLQVGTTTSYASPNATTATAAFGTKFLPPQTTATTGAYNNADTRTGPRRDGTAGTVPIDRANPLHWTSVLYADSSNTLAAPTLGYPITGTTQFLGYTCYADPAVRVAMAEILSLNVGKVTRDSVSRAVSTYLVRGIKAGQLGLLAQQNIAPLPPGWLNAINDTFLVKSTNAELAAKNLYIQSRLPTRTISQALPNPTCTAGKGA